ncbi:light-harvesting complex-like protein 3 isotype 1, chloroplastic [Quercus robur]|uniref:light-harvesting complex-like protein 3 isotype 1, chloroplastic n=1 Tax=Quercus robur TaxID=38942 RepID=UPI002162EF4E|nr:light-harvesting complex-like protein 3 isotype 1, chloroplastic [Quercus robur]
MWRQAINTIPFSLTCGNKSGNKSWFRHGHRTLWSKVVDERWKNGTWDLNMFVHDGKIDWDGVIVAEARRRKFLELHPEAATNQDPVLFRISIIPWWAWLMRSYLPEAKLINGRAAMVGFFMAYLVDALTGLDVVGQTGNFICKAGLFVTVISVILLRRTKDFENLKKLADKATFYDKQRQASWQDQIAGTGKKIYFASLYKFVLSLCYKKLGL